VPDLRGLTPDAAKALVEGLGFEFADGGQVDSDLEAGKIVRTDPEAGSISAKGVTITVFTSNGKQKPFPDVVGDGKSFTFSQAKSALKAAGYTQVTEACVEIAPASGETEGPTSPPIDPTDPRIGKVQSSDPPAGSPTVPGAPVTLTTGKIDCS
jgi:beta-lactam-binding protein with PASTA domain